MSAFPAPSIRSLGSLIGKIKWLLDAEFLRLLREAGVGVTPEQWSLMVAVHAGPEPTQTELARRVFKDKTNVTRLLDALERDGLVERVVHPADRRASLVRLTDSGCRITEVVFPVAHRLNAEALEALDEDERERLIDLLDKLKSGLAARRTTMTRAGRHDKSSFSRIF